MARKKEADSSSKPVEQEEEDSSSTEMEKDVQQPSQNDDASSSSDDETKKHPKKAINHSSSEEEEEEEEEEKQKSVIQKSQKSVSKPKKEKRPRPRPLEDKQKSKKPKKEEKEEGMSSLSKMKKPLGSGLFQRVFSDKDEIKILKGLVDYKVKKGVDPMVDLDEFLRFIKNSLECDCDKRQMVDKIKRFKKRFENDNKKLTNLHEHEIYELSKKIWEKPQITVSVGDDNNKNNNEVEVEVVVVNSGTGNARAGGGGKGKLRSHECDGEERLREKAMKLMGENEREELLQMWDNVHMAQMKENVMVLKEENRRILEALSQI